MRVPLLATKRTALRLEPKGNPPNEATSAERATRNVQLGERPAPSGHRAKVEDFRRRFVSAFGTYGVIFFSRMPLQSSRYRGGSDALTRAFRTLPQLPRARELANGAFKRSESATCRVFMRPARLCQRRLCFSALALKADPRIPRADDRMTKLWIAKIECMHTHLAVRRHAPDNTTLSCSQTHARTHARSAFKLLREPRTKCIHALARVSERFVPCIRTCEL